ncbi:MAG: sigma-70 family RNA polymerase sigma factor [Polyangiaceae bacterium]|jgi:RNA polymerase sigma-70 factor (ECF subfamily)
MPLSLEGGEASRLDVLSIHEEHADFVWRTLQRLGVRDADVEDQLQEVFVVVHHRLHTFDASARMTTWLFGICMRVASAYRRRAHRRREQIVADVPEEGLVDESGPEHEASAREARERLLGVLDLMDLEKRAIFVMFELDELPCDEIADVLGVPVGTVHSRLHAARKDFQAALARFSAREASRAALRRGGGKET